MSEGQAGTLHPRLRGLDEAGGKIPRRMRALWRRLFVFAQIVKLRALTEGVAALYSGMQRSRSGIAMNTLGLKRVGVDAADGPLKLSTRLSTGPLICYTTMELVY